MIGVLGSEIGDLTVLSVLAEKIPGYDLVFFGDTARAPYGSKSPDTVIEFALENIDFLIHQGARVILLACHTVSSVVIPFLKNRFDVPVLEMVTPAVELAIKTSRYQRIGIIGTRATISSGTYEEKILELSSEAKVFSAPCPLLGPLTEENWLKKPEAKMIVKKCLHPLKVRQIDTLLIGCALYPNLAKIIKRKIGKRVTMIDATLCVVDRLKDFLGKHDEIDKLLSKNGLIRIIVSDVTAQIEKTAKAMLKRKIHLEKIKPWDICAKSQKLV